MTGLRRFAVWLRWYVREVSGESAYDRYVTHQQRHDPDAALPTRREFERWRCDRQDASPRSRCC